MANIGVGCQKNVHGTLAFYQLSENWKHGNQCNNLLIHY
jgi:hypothetical protein